MERNCRRRIQKRRKRRRKKIRAIKKKRMGWKRNQLKRQMTQME